MSKEKGLCLHHHAKGARQKWDLSSNTFSKDCLFLEFSLVEIAHLELF